MNADRIHELYYQDQSNPATLRARERIHWICKQVQGENVLDIGCSQGITCLILGREGFECTGVDIEPAAIEYARRELQRESGIVQTRVRFECANATQLPFEDGSFSTVILSEILEHLTHPEKVLEEAYRVLQDKGRLIVTVPYGLNAFPDHKQTYYPISLLEHVQPFFRTMTVETVNRYIAYCGLKDSAYDFAEVPKGELFHDYLRLEKDLEKQFLARELEFLAARTKMQDQLAARANQIDALHQQVEEQAITITQKEYEIQDSLDKIRALEGMVDEARNTVAAVERELLDDLRRREHEWQCRLGELEHAHVAALAGKEQVVQELSDAHARQLADLVQEIQTVLAAKDAELRDALSAQEQAWQCKVDELIQAHTNDLAGKEEELSHLLAHRDSEWHERLRAKEHEIAEMSREHQRVLDAQEQDRNELEARFQQKMRSQALESAESLARVHQEWQEKLLGQEQQFGARISELKSQHGEALAVEQNEARQAKAQEEALATSLAQREQEWQTHLAAKEKEFKRLMDELERETAARLETATRAIQELQLVGVKRAELQTKVARETQHGEALSLADRVRQVAATVLPVASSVLVVSKGDEELLALDGRTGWHFPQTAEGIYAGYHPASSTEAIHHLEELRAKGAGYFLLPSPTFWWLDHYEEFRAYLEQHYQLICFYEDTCLIYALRKVAPERDQRLQLHLWYNRHSTGAPSATGRAVGTRAVGGRTVHQMSMPKVNGGAVHGAFSSTNRPNGNGVAHAAHASSSPAPSPASRLEPSQPDAEEAAESIRIGAVLDEFTTECFRPECQLITFRPDNWKMKLEKETPHTIFVESAWRGNEGAWQYRVAKYDRNMGDELLDLLAWAKARDIPSIFWNKEDPVHFERFIERAGSFDYVFTTDANCIAGYREQLGHDRVFSLPFAAQPALHNPVLENPRSGSVCFAGTYYGDRHEQRRKDLEHVLKPSLPFGLDIYDRQFGMTGKQAELFRFPDIYQPFIRGRLDYDEMVRAYKDYRVFLNVNSVTDSPTMFSRRVFELLACGTPVISSYSKGIVELLGEDTVFLSESEAETQRHLEHLLEDEEAWMRASTKGIRKVMEEHTYAIRLANMLEKVGIQSTKELHPKFTVVSAVRPDFGLSEWSAMLRQQTYRRFDVILLSDSPLPVEQLNRLRNELGEIPVTNIVWSSQDVFEQCQVFSSSAYFAIWDTRDYYGPDYLKDYALAVGYSNADCIGKHTYFRACEMGRELCSPGHEFRYSASIPSATLVARKDVLTERTFQKCFESRVFRSEKPIFSLDRFGYLQHGREMGKVTTVDGKVELRVEV